MTDTWKSDRGDGGIGCLLLIVVIIIIIVIASAGGGDGQTPDEVIARVPSPSSTTCVEDVAYQDLVDEGQLWRVVDRQESENATGRDSVVTFESRSETKVSVEIDKEISAELSGLVLPVVFGSVQASVNKQVSEETSTVVGSTTQVVVPSGTSATGIYGVRVQKTSGRLSGTTCSDGDIDLGAVVSYVPIAEGWCVWLSGQEPCKTLDPPTQAG